jgi:[ribosomal protein S5]-alanine N-acetyltransferase
MQNNKRMQSGRLELISSSAEHIRIELKTPELLSKKLNAVVSDNWPSGEYDKDAMEFFLSRFESEGEAASGWYGWYAINIDSQAGERALVGAGGYFGPPDESGIVEIGYSILPEWQRRGFASELVKILVTRASSIEKVTKIIAHTSADNLPSIKVLLSCGFTEVGSEEGNLRFELM